MMNNRERELWIDNDEGLYLWWKSTKLSKRAFLKLYRAEIDAAISKALDRGIFGGKPKRPDLGRPTY